jgi:iron uptake system component EfeO
MISACLVRCRTLAVGAAALAVGLLASGCGSASTASSPTGDDGVKVAITLTSADCVPAPASVPAGLVTFEITNKGASAVSEAELLKGSTVLGEKENLTPGLSGSLSLRLEPGSYVVACPNATTDHAEFTVTGSSTSTSADPSAAALGTAARAASAAYHDYVVAEVQQLVTASAAFTTAVKAGDIAAAKAAFGPARTHYESIEPVAESFGDLDPAIDSRADDVADAEQWTGFHRIEKALWADNSLDGMAQVADKLTADIAKLQSLVATQTYQPAQIANGSVELLDEVARTKVTGEEDRYSHTDLFDFEANVVGAKEGFTAVEPLLKTSDPALAATIQARFADVFDALQQHKQGNGWVGYSTVGDDARRALAQKVDALAEPLSEVAARVG